MKRLLLAVIMAFTVGAAQAQLFNTARLSNVIAAVESVFDNSGQPWPFFSQVNAINYDLGGNGVAFSTTVPGCGGSQSYRVDAMNFFASTDSGTSFYLGCLHAGDYMKYTANFALAGPYTISLRLANPEAGANWSVLVDNAQVATIAVPNTGSFATFLTATSGSFNATLGNHIIEILAANTGPSGVMGNVNWLMGAQAGALPAGFFVANNGTANTTCSISVPCTFAAAQTAMQQSSSIKRTYVRAGAYDARTFRVGGGHCGASIGGVGISMTSADNGETLQFYPPDGVNTAKIDGFQTTPGVNDTTNVDQGICVEGNNISVIGLHVTRFVGGNIVSGAGNNIISDNETDLSVGGPGAIQVADGNTAAHNYSHDNFGQGIGYNSNGAALVEYNVVDNNCSPTWSDCGSIYSYVGTGASTILRNYIHDNGGNQAAQYGSAWYQDGCGDNKIFIGNIATGVFYNGGFFNGGSNLNVTGEIDDLGTQPHGGQAIITSQSYNQGGCGTLSGNVFSKAIVVANSPSAGSGYSSNGGPFPTPVSSGPNMYHNYHGPDLPQINSTGPDGNDSNPQNQNPKFLACPGGGVDSWSYALDPTSPAFGSPVNYPAQTANDRGIAWGMPGYWGPVGFTLPHTGTPPSYGPC